MTKTAQLQEVFIRQPNMMTAARYDFSAVEKNIIYNIIAHIQGKDASNLNREIVLPYRILTKGKNHAEVREGINKLFERTLVYQKGEEWVEARIIESKAHHKKFDEYVRLRLGEAALPVLLELSRGFTKFSATIAISLKSVYSKRLYEMCKRYADTGWFQVSIDSLRHQFALENKYSRYSDFKRNVIEVPMRELEETADCYFSFTEIKKGRRIVALKFKVHQRSIDVENADPKMARIMVRLKVIGFTSAQIQQIIDAIPFKELNQVLFQVEQAARDGKIRGTATGYFLAITKEFNPLKN